MEEMGEVPKSAVVMKLTPQGTLRMEQVTQAFQVLEDQAFQDIPPAQRAAFLQTLQKVYDNLGKEAAAL